MWVPKAICTSAYQPCTNLGTGVVSAYAFWYFISKRRIITMCFLYCTNKCQSVMSVCYAFPIYGNHEGENRSLRGSKRRIAGRTSQTRYNCAVEPAVWNVVMSVDRVPQPVFKVGTDGTAIALKTKYITIILIQHTEYLLIFYFSKVIFSHFYSTSRVWACLHHGEWYFFRMFVQI